MWWKIWDDKELVEENISTEAEAREKLKHHQQGSLYTYAENDSGDYIEDFDGPVTIARPKGLD